MGKDFKTYSPVHLWVLSLFSQVKYCFAESAQQQKGPLESEVPLSTTVLSQCLSSISAQILFALHYRCHAWGSIKLVRHQIEWVFITSNWKWIIWKLQNYNGHLYQVHLTTTAESHSQSDMSLPNGCTCLYAAEDTLSVKKKAEPH